MSAFAFLLVSASGIRPCNLAFGADQFNPNTKSGKRGISSFFKWYFFTFTFAMMASLTVIVYVQSKVSWAWGLALPTFLMFLSCAFVFIGTRIYVMVVPQGSPLTSTAQSTNSTPALNLEKGESTASSILLHLDFFHDGVVDTSRLCGLIIGVRVKPEGSPLTSVVQVLVIAAKKRRLAEPEQPWLSLFNYMPPNSINSMLPYIAIQTDQQPTRGGFALCIQQNTYVVFQALQSNRHVGKTTFQIPAAPCLQHADPHLWRPIYYRILVPILRRLTRKEGGIIILQRMGIGIALSVLTSLVAAIVEKWWRTLALTKPTPGIERQRVAISSMPALWLVPQVSLAGLAEAFMANGQVEFYYEQFLENMRSIAGSFFCGMAASSYLSGFLVSIVHHKTHGAGTAYWLREDLNKGRLEHFYYLVAGLEAIN
ncbi:major facilitator superfamily protein [Actinidia rufa]|uniref:Major facilitator superfamily protein n=1 Tax=Actinidia rufa TaxID=165716 RepID=A0A7J0H3D2_9ERIC|nr:major facilitator superfamily protein [Actinidia rufa]